MSTTVHIPDALLEKASLRAKARGISRNRLIVEALTASLATRTEWSPEVLTMLAEAVDDEAEEALAETMSEVARGRRSRRAPVGLP